MNNDQFTQILRAINNVRDDLKEFKDEMNRRWDENDKRWEKNDKKISKLELKVDMNHKEMRDTFDAYENSIENIYQENNQRIIVLEKMLKVVSA